MTPLGNVLYVFPSNQTSRESFLGSSEHSVVVSTAVIIIATVDLCFGGNKTRKKKKDDFFFLLEHYTMLGCQEKQGTCIYV